LLATDEEVTGMQKVFVALGVLVLALLAGYKAAQDTTVTPGIDSLNSLSIHVLRNRDYGSSLEVVERPDLVC
jgi:hypothetical protein